MALVFRTFYTEGIAQLSYLVGDDAAGLATVIDPRRDVDIYVEAAAREGLRIAYAIETHIHADFASGTRELAARTGAEIAGGESDYGFDLRRLRDGDELYLGEVTLRALHTPGHTPEHVCLALWAGSQGDAPFGAFTGDTLFNLDVGRPDLLGNEVERRLAGKLHDSLFGRLMPMGDGAAVWPGHGAGSACGKSLGDLLATTIGHERRTNPALQPRSREEFAAWILGGMPEPPRHYARLKRISAHGAPVRGAVPAPAPLMPDALEAAMREGAALVDTRSMLAFGGGHVPGALNIGLGKEFPMWLGWMVEHGTPIILVAEGPEQALEAATHAFRLGYDTVRGWLGHGMTAWQNTASRSSLSSSGRRTIWRRAARIAHSRSWMSACRRSTRPDACRAHATSTCRVSPGGWTSSTANARSPSTAGAAIAPPSAPPYWRRRDSAMLRTFPVPGRPGCPRSCRSRG